MSDTRDDNDQRIGDADPEDAWDDGDTVEAKLDVLERVVTALRALEQVPPERRDDALRLVAKLRRARATIEDRIVAIHDALKGM